MSKFKSYKNEFLRVLQTVSQDRQLLDEFLQDLLTPNERKILILRWQIVKRLARRESQRKIAKDLNVGIATVTRGARELRNPKGGFQLALKRTGLV